MDCVGKPEIATQKRVIDFFQTKLRYNYIGNLKDRENRNIDEEKLITWLTKKVQFRRLASVHVACTSCHTDLLTIPGCPFST